MLLADTRDNDNAIGVIGNNSADDVMLCLLLELLGEVLNA